MDSLEKIPVDMLEFPHNDQPAKVLPEAITIELNGDEFWPLSGRPYFHVMMTDSNLTHHQLVVPVKLHPILPSLSIPITVTYKGKTWEMVYSGKGKHKRINSGWKGFSIDNNLKVGDACVFELMKCSSKEINFRVQILRGDIPSKFQHEMTGESADTPIDIE